MSSIIFRSKIPEECVNFLEAKHKKTNTSTTTQHKEREMNTKNLLTKTIRSGIKTNQSEADEGLHKRKGPAHGPIERRGSEWGLP